MVSLPDEGCIYACPTADAPERVLTYKASTGRPPNLGAPSIAWLGDGDGDVVKVATSHDGQTAAAGLLRIRYGYRWAGPWEDSP